jgi:nucleoside-diphosphate-sugar epimerase
VDVFIIGATGFVGTAIDESLCVRGHHTIGTARSETARAKLQARGTKAVMADAANPRTLVEQARACDATIYCAQITDADAYRVETKALRMLARALAGTEKRFVYTSSVWVYGETGDEPAREETPLAAPTLVARRPELEAITLAMSGLGIRANIVRPGVVYGRGNGIPAMFVQSARERGASIVMGDGTNRWATVEVHDLGEMFAAVLEQGHPGRAYNAVNGDAFAVRQIAEAASRGAGAGGNISFILPTALGPFSECLALDQRVSGARAKADLGWTPRSTSIVEELEFGSYLPSRKAS